jgi:hypothetical protein
MENGKNERETVAFLMDHDPSETLPGDRLVGVESARTAQAALAALLIAKGVFTVEEYTSMQASAVEEEHRRYMTRGGVQFDGEAGIIRPS